jgi:hypothetical protein
MSLVVLALAKRADTRAAMVKSSSAPEEGVAIMTKIKAIPAKAGGSVVATMKVRVILVRLSVRRGERPIMQLQTSMAEKIPVVPLRTGELAEIMATTLGRVTSMVVETLADPSLVLLIR